MHRGFKFKLNPTVDQAVTLGRWIGATRLVYNLALEQRRDFWRQFREAEGRPIGWVFQSREVTDLRREYNFIRAVPRACLEQAIRDLDRAFSAFFAGRAGYPDWRKRGRNDAIRFQARECPTEKVNAKWGRVRLPNIGWVSFRRSRDIPGEVGTITVAETSSGWSVVFSSDIGPAPSLASGSAVGIDRGVANTLSLSTGEHLRMDICNGLDRRTRKAQRVLARRRKGSKRYLAQRRRVAALKSRAARTREHWAQVTTTRVARQHTFVAIEALDVRAMTASARGTIEAPGRRVRQKAGLNRSILEQSWGRIASMLEYKLEAAGGRLVVVSAAFTSQTCQACGVIDARSRKSQAIFECVHCGHRDHADTNAAIEIRRRSTALLDVEGGHFKPPAEASTLVA